MHENSSLSPANPSTTPNAPAPIAGKPSFSLFPFFAATFHTYSIRFRSCFEFIAEAIGRMFLMILFHHLTSIAKLPVRINDGTKGQKQAPIDPKERRKLRPNSSLK